MNTSRRVLVVGGVAGNGLAGALYIGSRLGPGPRDGLWLGLVRKTGPIAQFFLPRVQATLNS